MVDSLTVNGYSNPSYYQMLLAQQSAGAASTPADTTKVSTPSFQGTIPRAQEKADSSVTAALLTTGVLAVGAATCILTKGKGKVLSTERWKTGWDAIKKDWFGIGKKASEGAAFQIRKVDGQDIISLPEKSRSFNVNASGAYKNSTQLAQEAKNLGLEVNPTLAFTDDAAKLKSTKFSFDFGSGRATKKYEGIIHEGKLVGLKDAHGNKVALNSVSEKLKTKLDSIIEQIVTKKVPAGVTLKDTTYVQTFEGGSALFVANSSKNGLRSIRTNRYRMTDDAVVAARKDSKINQGILDYNAGKFESWNITEGVWKPSKSKTFWEKIGLAKSSEYKGQITGKKWDDTIELVVKDNKVVGLSRDGGKTMFAKSGSTEFSRYEADYPQIFEDVLKHNKDFTGNIVRTFG